MLLKLLYWLLVVAGIVALAGALAVEGYTMVAAFSGEMCIAVGRAERIVVRKSVEPPEILKRLRVKLDSDLVSQAAAPGDIDFEDKGTSAGLLDPAQRYDAARLPFVLRLKQIKVLSQSEPADTLKIVSQDGTSTPRPVAVGQPIEIDGQLFTLREIRKWTGLIDDSHGVPLASVSVTLDGEAWTENVFLAAETWRVLGPGVALRMSWHASESEARDAVASGLDRAAPARWGVVDGDAVNWFESFDPGTGTTTSDGAEVALVRRDDRHESSDGPHPAIEVQIIREGKKESVWIAANERDSDAQVRFEDYALADTVILVGAYAPGRACCAAYRHGKLDGETALEAGQTWSIPETPGRFRLEQAMPRAAVVPLEDSTLYEAVLQGGGRELRLRQGESVRVGGVFVVFDRKADPPRVRYDLSASGIERPFSIDPDETVKLRGWRLSQGPPGPDPLRTALLHAEHTAVHPYVRIVLAASIALLVWLAFFGRPTKRFETSPVLSEEDEAVPDEEPPAQDS